MNIKELKEMLNKESIPNNWYSINDTYIDDVLVLRKIELKKENYSYWEFFYVDEKGNENNGYKRFDVESIACEFLYNKLMQKKRQFKTWEDYHK